MTQGSDDGDEARASSAYASVLRLTSDDGGVLEGPEAVEFLRARQVPSAPRASGRASGVVRVWHADDGWGVIDSEATPGGCFAHFAAVEGTGFRALTAGEPVAIAWEAGEQDGYAYRATLVTRSEA